MKNICLLILVTVFFSHASGQSLHNLGKINLDPASYVDVNFDGKYNPHDGDFLVTGDAANQNDNSIILHAFNILWVFNDVGNVSSNKIISSGCEIHSVTSKKVDQKSNK